MQGCRSLIVEAPAPTPLQGSEESELDTNTDLKVGLQDTHTEVAMVRKSVEPDAVDRSGVVQPKPQKASAEHAKLLATAKKMRRLGNTETSPLGPLYLSPFQDTPVSRVKVVGETTAETMSLLSASIENICAENTNNNSNALQTLDHRGIKPGPGVTSSFQYHILAVDDNHVDQRLIEKLLKISSYKVTTVNSAFKALEVLGLSESPAGSFKNLDINLIMTDYCMPKMTGYDLLKQVKAKTSALKEIPVIVMSSENDTNRIKRCLAEGAEEFIIKPVQMSDVERLWGHIWSQSPTSTSSATKLTGESSGSSACGKRKAEPFDLHEILSPERQPPWPSNFFVT